MKPAHKNNPFQNLICTYYKITSLVGMIVFLSFITFSLTSKLFVVVGMLQGGLILLCLVCLLYIYEAMQHIYKQGNSYPIVRCPGKRSGKRLRRITAVLVWLLSIPFILAPPLPLMVRTICAAINVMAIIVSMLWRTKLYQIISNYDPKRR